MGNGFLYDEDAYTEFVERVYASYEHPANKQRLGQVYFNKLKKERPDIAEKIRGTLFDPFYNDFVHQKIDDFVFSLWRES